jgi:hypothetical protein
MPSKHIRILTTAIATLLGLAGKPAVPFRTDRSPNQK